MCASTNQNSAGLGVLQLADLAEQQGRQPARLLDLLCLGAGGGTVCRAVAAAQVPTWGPKLSPATPQHQPRPRAWVVVRVAVCGWWLVLGTWEHPCLLC